MATPRPLVVGLLLALTACDAGRSDELAAPAHAAALAETERLGGYSRCWEVPFVASVDVAEASGAAYFEEAGRSYVVVTSDSGGGGDAVIVDLLTGESHLTLLPLDDAASDDLEGLESDGPDTVVGLTSSGWLRTWHRSGFSFELVGAAQPISDDPRFVCDSGTEVNCRANYEGLCISPDTGLGGDACAGYAASKTDGHLYCLVRAGAGWRLDPSRSVGVAGSERLTGCSYGASPPHSIITITNSFDFGRIRRITGADTEAPQVEPMGIWGVGFPETVVTIPGGLLAFSDTGTRPSRVRRFACE